METTIPWEWPAGTREETKGQVEAILWSLYEDGDIGGTTNAIAILRERLAERGVEMPAYPSHVLSELDGGRFGNCIERDVAVKRTTAIRLLLSLEEMPERPAWLEPVNAPEDDEPVPEEPEPEPEPEPAALGDVLERAIGNVVAAANPLDEDYVQGDADLLIDRLSLIQAQAVGAMMDVADLAARLATGDTTTANRLADALDENGRLRRANRDLEETLRAKVAECNSVRRALKQAQANVEAFRTGARVNDSGFRALDRIMREPPHPKGNGR